MYAASNTPTFSMPWRAARLYAIASPFTPPPITMTSYCDRGSRCFRNVRLRRRPLTRDSSRRGATRGGRGRSRLPGSASGGAPPTSRARGDATGHPSRSGERERARRLPGGSRLRSASAPRVARGRRPFRRRRGSTRSSRRRRRGRPHRRRRSGLRPPGAGVRPRPRVSRRPT